MNMSAVSQETSFLMTIETRTKKKTKRNKQEEKSLKRAEKRVAFESNNVRHPAFKSIIHQRVSAATRVGNVTQRNKL